MKKFIVLRYEFLYTDDRKVGETEVESLIIFGIKNVAFCSLLCYRHICSVVFAFQLFCYLPRSCVCTDVFEKR